MNKPEVILQDLLAASRAAYVAIEAVIPAVCPEDSVEVTGPAGQLLHAHYLLRLAMRAAAEYLAGGDS